MGDYTITETTIASRDLDRAKEALLGPDWEDDGFSDEWDNGDGTITFVQHDVSWGGEKDARKLEAARIPFTMKNDAGASHGPGYIAFDGNERISQEGFGDRLNVAFNQETGEPDPGEIEAAKRFLAVKRAAEARMRG